MTTRIEILDWIAARMSTHGGAFTEEIAEHFGLTKNAVIGHLRLLAKKDNAIVGVWDSNDNGHNAKHWGIREQKLVATVTDIDDAVEDLVTRAVHWCQDTNDPALRVLPRRYGGKQTKGSGQMSAFKNFARILLESEIMSVTG